MTGTPICRVGLDLGGTGSRAISVVDGHVADARDIPTAVLGAGPVSERVTQLVEFIESVIPDDTTLASVGIGASGPVDIETGIIHNSETLPWFSGFPLVEQLTAKLHVPVGIDNDAVAAALGEYSLGAGREVSRLLLITLGTGVGVSMLIDGQPVRGLNGAHPEGGHIPISSDTFRCYCGLTGCWEQHASRTALQTALSEALGGSTPTKDLIHNAMNQAAGNERVLGVFREYGLAVGRGLAVLHTLYQPQVTVIGGTAAACLPVLEEDIHSALARSGPFRVDVELRSASLGDNAGAVGAALGIPSGHLATLAPLSGAR